MMPDPKHTTISGAPHGLKEAFSKARRAAEKDEAGVAYLDPSGVGTPTSIVFDDDEFDEWVASPSSVLDQSGTYTLDENTLAEAIANEVVDQ